MTNTISNSDVLATVNGSIDSFLALPCYSILSDIPNDLTLKAFIPSKDNVGSVLSGTQEMFRSIDPAQFNFTLPVKAVKPDKPVKPFDFVGKAKNEYWESLEAWSDWDTTDEALFNVEIDKTATRLLQHDITRKYQRLLRVCQFVRSHDASMFDHDEELDLFDLPETTRQKILAVYQSAFNVSPCLLMTGSTLNLLELDSYCTLDNVEGIDRIISIKNSNPSASYAFMGRDQLVQVIKAIKSEVNAPTLLKIASRLDSHLGGSKNATTIVANLRMLHGFKPSKGKAKAA